jgi:NADH dehydrogenase
MSTSSIHAVTGAFGYSGKYIAKKLLVKGHKVITLTNSLHRQNPFGEAVQAFPFHFDQPEKLSATLQGAEVLYNTYWVRFNHKMFRRWDRMVDYSIDETHCFSICTKYKMSKLLSHLLTHADAVQNILVLFNAAKAAGVERIVHVSITNPSEESPLEYFRGKAQLERALKELGISYVILRPTVLFGKEDILINNIAWALRRFPLFGVFGDGWYRIQPIYVDDLAELAVQWGEKRDNVIVDAIGPETFTYRALVETIGSLIGKTRPIVSMPPSVGYFAGWIIGKLVNDVMITREEIDGLMADLLFVDSPPAGKTRLTNWAREHRDALGLKYTSELMRRRDREAEYASN